MSLADTQYLGIIENIFRTWHVWSKENRTGVTI